MFNFTNTNKPRQQELSAAPASSQNLSGSTLQNQNLTSMEALAEQKAQEIEAQRIAFTQKNPGFDMKAEMENPAFKKYLWGNGLTVEEAYFLAHREELLENARAEALESLAERQDRIVENGAAKNRPAIAKKNPKDLTDKEIDAIIERVRNGEKITF